MVADSYNHIKLHYIILLWKKTFLICLLTYAHHKVLNLVYLHLFGFPWRRIFLYPFAPILQNTREPTVYTQTVTKPIRAYLKPVSVVENEININYHHLNAVVWPHSTYSAKILLHTVA